MTRFRSLIFLLVLLLHSLLSAQDKISVESTVDKQAITIGDHMTYTVKITSDTALTVDSLSVGTNLGMFEIKDYKPRQTKIEGGTRVSTEAFTITTFTTGDYQIPPVTIHYRTPSGEMKSINTDPLPIKINSLLTGEQGEDIKPIKPQRTFKPVFPIWWVVGGIALIAALLTFFILYRRAKKPIDLSSEAVDTRLPWEIALEELAKLKESDFVARAEYKLFYLRLSEIFRAYLERRYGIAALERTTDEILDEFKAMGLDKKEEKAIKQLLDGCDIVKFAKHQPTPEDADNDLNASKDFVMQTRSLPYSTVKEAQ